VTTAIATTVAAGPAQAASAACGPAALVAVNTSDTHLYRWTTPDAAAHNFSAAARVGVNWSGIRLVASDATSGDLFAVTNAGYLHRYWFSGTGYTGGTEIGYGWENVTQLISAGGGVLFARDSSGALRWYRWLNDALGSGWAAGSGTQIGTGWNGFSKLFGGSGVVYGVRASDGALLWYRNRNPLEPYPVWEGPATVGAGWGGFREITDVGGGYIFATNAAGTLVEYHHLGYQTGAATWEVGTGIALGPGWGSYNRLTAGPTACGLLDPPVELRAYPGGDGIALRWNPPAGSSPSRYTVYRDGTQIATVTAAPSGALVRTARYVDRGLAAGLSHVYRVSMTTASGLTTAQSAPVSSAVSAVVPTQVPTVIVDNPYPNLGPQVDYIRQLIRDWYPKIVYALAVPDYTPPSTITVQIGQDPRDRPGVTTGAHILLDLDTASSLGGNVQTALSNPNYGGLVLHEMTHVVQQYPNGTPLYIGEGLATWVSHEIYNDADTPFPTSTYTADPYSPAAYLIRAASTLYKDPGLPRALNQAAHAGTYSDAVFTVRTGHTISGIWSVATHPRAIP
jgi:hypothetical protein